MPILPCSSGCSLFLRLSQTNTSVCILKLEHCVVGDADETLLADALRSNRTITDLTVSHVRMTDWGMAALVAAIDVSADWTAQARASESFVGSCAHTLSPRPLLSLSASFLLSFWPFLRATLD